MIIWTWGIRVTFALDEVLAQGDMDVTRFWGGGSRRGVWDQRPDRAHVGQS
jgi:hypothetical protein